MKNAQPTVGSFRGLNNVADPLRLGLDWLVRADNCDITQTRSLVRAGGYQKKVSATKVAGAYATEDLKRLYLIDNGTLYQVGADHSKSVLRTGLSSAPYSFDEVNGVVYFANGTDYGIITSSGARPWGIEPPPGLGNTTVPAGAKGIVLSVCTYVDQWGMESANGPVSFAGYGGSVSVPNVPTKAGYSTNIYVTQPDGTVFHLLQEGVTAGGKFNNPSLGRELPFWNVSPPSGSIISHFQGRMHIAEVFPQFDQSVIWRSLPLHFHHFDHGSDAIIVPGTVRMMADSEQALIIGTDRAVYAFNGESLDMLAPYGVVPGWHTATHDGALLFWTLRGLCRAMPFQNLTQGTVSVAPGLSAGGMVIERDGYKRYVVALQSGGEAYNKR